MNEIFLIIIALTSAGAGYFLGRYVETLETLRILKDIRESIE